MEKRRRKKRRAWNVIATAWKVNKVRYYPYKFKRNYQLFGQIQRDCQSFALYILCPLNEIKNTTLSVSNWKKYGVRRELNGDFRLVYSLSSLRSGSKLHIRLKSAPLNSCWTIYYYNQLGNNILRDQGRKATISRVRHIIFYHIDNRNSTWEACETGRKSIFLPAPQASKVEFSIEVWRKMIFLDRILWKGEK